MSFSQFKWEICFLVEIWKCFLVGFSIRSSFSSNQNEVRLKSTFKSRLKIRFLMSTEKKTLKLPNFIKFEIPTKKRFRSHGSASFTAISRLSSNTPVWTYPAKNDSSGHQDWGIKKRRYDPHNKNSWAFRWGAFRLPVAMFSTSGFWKTAHFRSEVETGSLNVDDAEAEGELYTSPKFHPNPSCSLWGEEGSTLK